MGESLILLLVNPNDGFYSLSLSLSLIELMSRVEYNLCSVWLMQNVRQCGKSILEQVSNTRGLACGLKFLYS